MLNQLFLCVPVASPSTTEDPENEVDAAQKDEVLLNVIRPDYERPPPPPPMQPLFDLTADGKVQGKRLLRKSLTTKTLFIMLPPHMFLAVMCLCRNSC